MRILWIKVGGLWPLHTGGRLRSFQILGELAQRHSVTVLTTHGHGDDPAGLAERLPGAEVLSFPHAPPKQGGARFAVALLRSWLTRLPVDLAKWRVPDLSRAVLERLSPGSADVCVVDFLTTVPNVRLRCDVPVVLFEHNVEHAIWKRLHDVERRPWARSALALEWRKVRACEARACTEARLTLAVSDVDQCSLRTMAPAARVEAIPTGVDVEYFRPRPGAERPGQLVFTGSMDWYPNEDGMLDFLHGAWPRVRARVPHARLAIVGRNPAARLRQAASAAGGVTVTGTVDDVRPFVEQAALYVAPLRVGGGTRLKLFEALAMGKAVVATPLAAEGLPIVPGRHYVAAEGPAGFADAVVDLLGTPERAAALGAAGRQLVEERFSWPRVADEVERLLVKVVRESQPVKSRVVRVA